MQNFKFVGAMVSGFRVFKKDEEDEDDESCFPVFHSRVIFHPIFACCYFFTRSPPSCH